MNTARKLAIGVGALSAITSVAHAQNISTATASGSATIIQPITITSNGTALGFGTIVKPSDATTATVTVGNDGQRSITGAAAGLGASTAAGFKIIGEGGSAYNVSIPPSINLVSGTNTLVVSTTNSWDGSAYLGGASTPPGGATTNSFAVGGSLNVSGATPSGAYTGSFTVTANYQ